MEKCNKGGKGDSEADGFVEGKFVGEMNPNMVLPTLIEVKDEEWIFTVAMTIPGNEVGKRFPMTESTRFKEESRLQREGAYVKPS